MPGIKRGFARSGAGRRIGPGVAGLMLLGLATPLTAGEALPGLARCAGIRNDAQRLACYDELARSVADDTATGWQLSDAGGSRGLELVVLADREIQGRDVAYRPVLVIACSEDRFEAFVRTGMAAANEYGSEEKTAVLRFDQDEPFTELLTESSGHNALYFSSPLMVASQLLRHDELYFQFMPRQARPASVVFRVRGLDEALAPLLEACGLVVADDGILERRP